MGGQKIIECRRWVKGGAIVWVSLSLLITNLLGKEQVEASSPEESYKVTLPALTFLNSVQSSTHFSQQAWSPLPSPVSPLLVQNVFPYQPNPLAAIVAAGLTLTFMALKETGKVDLEGILFLLNSTDLYAGLAGSIQGALAQSGSGYLARRLAKGASSASPKVLKPFLASETSRVLANIVNGLTYTLAVSTGFEYFSQFWKFATKNIEGVSTVTGFFQAPLAVQKAVYSNLMYYSVIDVRMQKRILDSVYNHRILTFEFIMMNVGLYVGAQLGHYLAQKYGTGYPSAVKLGPVLGSVALGMGVQLLPIRLKTAANHKLLEMKINHQKEKVEDLYKLIEGRVNRFDYPPKDVSGVSSYWMKGVDLGADIERLLRAFDILSSLHIQQMNSEYSEVFFSFLLEPFHVLEQKLTTLKKNIQSQKTQSLMSSLQNKNPKEIQDFVLRTYHDRKYFYYYEALLEEAAEGIRSRIQEIQGLQKALHFQTTF